jgi:hypothetical protein
LAEVEVVERVLAIQVDDDFRHLGVQEIEHVRRVRSRRAKRKPTCLAAPAEPRENQYARFAELAILVPFDSNSSQALTHARKPSGDSPVQLPGSGPSTTTYSISVCAHSNELKPPRSRAA